MKLEIIARDEDPGLCSGGVCPTLYRDKHGKLFIQGYDVDDEIKSAANPPEGESVVEITENLLLKLKEL